ncbi:hypothetical protein N780_11060 [Pontibacillus chungwhensis BH030062]|uniref:Uncharacterized protein n=1 Tax=Pontibacillus chungwhensis BH030062 TaxID=1385513 RepID=A0A0A2V389_9BACI|nr:hypothetical protein [Pontibacillus chungwhensis]KGP93276.1 hypothetical protein N780_11060 [Pontibacillus chungwhensis BH030062]
MVGSVLWNVLFASVGALLTLGLSFPQNTVPTTSIKVGVVFTFFYLFMYLFRKAIGVSSVSVERQDGEAWEEDNSEVEFQKTNKQDQGRGSHLSEDEAKQTSDMVRALLNEDQ